MLDAIYSGCGCQGLQQSPVNIDKCLQGQGHAGNLAAYLMALSGSRMAPRSRLAAAKQQDFRAFCDGALIQVQQIKQNSIRHLQISAKIVLSPSMLWSS